jgi:hypothetical protein
MLKEVVHDLSSGKYSKWRTGTALTPKREAAGSFVSLTIYQNT